MRIRWITRRHAYHQAVLILIPGVLGAQITGRITGHVTEVDGRPLTQASVSLVGTTRGTVSRPDGSFTFDTVAVGPHAVEVRRLGYTPVTRFIIVSAGESAVADARLAPQAVVLDEVVSIGYGTSKRKDLTGAVAVLTGDQFKTQAAPTPTLSAGLQGKLPGVQVVSNSGLPGIGLRVRVRGTGSITANAEPLYVIDELPAAQGTNSFNPQDNPLLSIDPTEIESIEILKDASATAIYGARGANGVVLITTRRGQRGDSRLTAETSYGIQQISKKIPVLNAQQFMQLSNEAATNAGRSPLFASEQMATALTYDYPSLLMRTAPQVNEMLSLSGGDERARYLLGGSYTRQDGIELGSNLERYGLRLNLDTDLGKRLRAGTSVALTRTARNAPAQDNGSLGNSANGIEAAMQFAPFQAPKDSSGNWVKTSPTTEPVANPIATANQLQDLNVFNRLLGSMFGEVDITPRLTARAMLGSNFQFDNVNYYAPRTILAGGAAGIASITSSQTRDLTSENTLAYRGASFGPGRMDLLAGWAAQAFHSEFVTGGGALFPTDATTIYNLGSAAQPGTATSGVNDAAVLSYLGRLTYTLADRYMLTLTGRYDGSSRFGAHNKWALFPSAAFAWRVSDERFMKGRKGVIDDLKLRLSYGTVGNQAVNSYQSLAALGVQWYSFGSVEIPALAPTGAMPNPNLRWEQQAQANVGMDASFFSSRVALTVDAYRSITRNLLLALPVPSTTGFASQLRNIGAVTNRGLEIGLNTLNVYRRQFTWRTSVNFSENRNRVMDIGPIPQFIGGARGIGGFFSPGDTHIIRVGLPLGSIYGYRVVGLWQQGDECLLKNRAECTPGEYKIADTDGDGAITGSDRVVLGQADPKLMGGVANDFTFGPLSVSALVTFVSGNRVINAGNSYGGLGIMQANERATMLDHWSPTNTKTLVPRPNNARVRRLYSTLVEDGAYARLQTLSFGWQVPPRLVPRAQAARVFVTGQNLWIATHYSGFDPDVNSAGGDARIGGTDVGAYPRSRVWNVGATISY